MDGPARARGEGGDLAAHALNSPADMTSASPPTLLRSRPTSSFVLCVAARHDGVDVWRPCPWTWMGIGHVASKPSPINKQPRRVRPAAGARGCTGAAPLHTLRFALALAPAPGPRKRRSCLDTCGQNGRQRRRRDRVFGRAGDKWAVGPASEGTERGQSIDAEGERGSGVSRRPPWAPLAFHCL